MHTTFRADYSAGGAGSRSCEMEIQPRECKMHTSLMWSPGPSHAELLILRDVQILRRSLYLIPRLFLFFLSGGRRCENIPKIFLLTALFWSWKTRTCFREWDTSWQSSARLRRQTQQQFCGIPQIQVRKYLNLTSQPCLPMGWALKSSHVPRTTFAEKQKDYLTS